MVARYGSFRRLLALAALSGLALSPVTVTSRGHLWLGPQTAVLTGIGLISAILIALAARHCAENAKASFLEPHRPPVAALAVILIVAPLLSMTILRFCFAAFPNSGDEYVFLFQSWTYLAGRLHNPPPPDGTLFGVMYIIDMAGHWVGQYLPGWPGALALVQAVGLPAWCAAAVSGAVLLALLYGALGRVCGSAGVRLALLFAYACSGFFLLNGATYYSHCFSAAAVMGSLYCLLRSGANSASWWAGAGFCAGLAGLCRMDSGLLAAIAASAAWAEQGFRPKALLAGLAGLVPPLSLLLFYNAEITGDPFLIPTMWAGNLSLTAGGIGGVEAAVPHPRVPIQTLWRLGELADTASLLIPALYLFALTQRWKARRFRFYDLVPPANLILFMIFPDLGGFQMGPRYWFDGFAVMHLTVGSVFSGGLGSRRRFAVAACLLLGALELARLPGQVIFFSRVLQERAEVYRLGAQLPRDRQSLILVPDFQSAWNERFDRTGAHRAFDFARNGISVEGPVLYGRGDAPDGLERACRLYPAAAIYRFKLDRDRPDGVLQPLDCPG